MTPQTQIPLYEDDLVAVFPDYELRGGRSVIVIHRGSRAMSMESTATWGKRIRKYWLDLMARKCVVHPDRQAARYSWKPKMPGEMIPVCAECGDGSPQSINAIFQTRAAMVRAGKL